MSSTIKVQGARVHNLKNLSVEIPRDQLVVDVYKRQLMEARGVRVDVELLRAIFKEFTEEVAALDKEIQKVAGHEFKVNSPQQLQTVLFDEMGLTTVKKIKSGYSTDASSLEACLLYTSRCV